MFTPNAPPLIPAECAGDFARTMAHDTPIAATFQALISGLSLDSIFGSEGFTQVNFPATGCTLAGLQAGQACLLQAQEPVSQTTMQVGGAMLIAITDTDTTVIGVALQHPPACVSLLHVFLLAIFRSRWIRVRSRQHRTCRSTVPVDTVRHCLRRAHRQVTAPARPKLAHR